MRTGDWRARGRMALAMAMGVLVALTGGARGGDADAAAGAEAGGKHLRILTVGNSFSDNPLSMLNDIVKSAPFGDTIEIGRANIGGCSFQRHLEHAKAFIADPEDEKSRPYTVGPREKREKRSLKEMCAARPWDIIITQQVSHFSWNPKTYSPEGDELIALIREYAPKSEIILQQTWTYRADSDFFKQNGMTDERDMHNRIRDNYRDAATRWNLRLMPVAEAIRRALDDKEWNYSITEGFDRKTAKPGELPTEHHSLHVGFGWWGKDKDGNVRLNYDHNHLNRDGRYLAGLMWYGYLFGRDPRAVTYLPKDMPAEDAAILRRIAAETLKSTLDKAPWVAE